MLTAADAAHRLPLRQYGGSWYGSHSLQRRDGDEWLAGLRQLPVVLKFGAVRLGPFYHPTEGLARQASFHHGRRGDFDNGFLVPADGVEMGRRVVLVVHVDG